MIFDLSLISAALSGRPPGQQGRVPLRQCCPVSVEDSSEDLRRQQSYPLKEPAWAFKDPRIEEIENPYAINNRRGASKDPALVLYGIRLLEPAIP